MTSERRYLPAAGKDAFLPLYDPITKLFGFQRALDGLLAQAALRPHHAILDVGCGTGTLAVAVSARCPGVRVTGLDPDPKALARARRKAERAGAAVQLDRGFADALPYGEGTFDRVFSSMMFHHLPTEDRARVLAEIRRVLKPGGRLEFLDFAGSGHSVLAHVFHGRRGTQAAGEDRLLRRMKEAGFSEARKIGEQRTFFGPIASYQALR
jgi:ubiquinone/menaquinone biosynthesis C-methylase UbiE